MEDEKEKRGVFCKALVKETDAGVEVTTTVTVKEKGSDELSNIQSVTIDRH